MANKAVVYSRARNREPEFQKRMDRTYVGVLKKYKQLKEKKM